MKCTSAVIKVATRTKCVHCNDLNFLLSNMLILAQENFIGRREMNCERADLFE